MKNSRFLIAILAAGLLVAAILGGTVQAASITVNTTDDELNADGDCSLREAIQSANADATVDSCTAGSGADTITVPPGTYTLSIAGAFEDANATGDLDITAPLIINGAGAGVSIIDGAALDRVFHIHLGISVELNGLTVQNGRSPARGGGISNAGTLTLTNSAVSDNTAPFLSGGGIEQLGTLTLNHSTVSGNTSGSSGGGIINFGASSITLLESSTVSGNTAVGDAGGISNAGTLTLINSTVSGNTAGIGKVGGGIVNFATGATTTLESSTVSGNTASVGGGIANTGGGATLTATNTTVSGNTSSSIGGGIYNAGQMTLNNSTISGNTAPTSSGGGIYHQSFTLSLKNTIIADNISGGDCGGAGSVNSLGHNIDSDGTCGLTGTGDISSVNPLLGPLQNNGGLTATHALLIGSPALDAGSNDCPPPSTDQRGISRPQGGVNCDIGAFESGLGTSDVTDPVVTLATPPDGAVYDQNEVVLADYLCTDEVGGSGIASCVGDVADGLAIDTTALGAHSFTLTGTDNAGNQTVVIHGYTVVEPILALDDSATTVEGTAVDIDVLLNDSDSANGPITAVIVDGPANGTVSNSPDGTIKYSPSTGITERVSLGISGAESDGRSQQATMSADGFWIAFSSNATNLVVGDTNNQRDIFVRNRETGATELISVKNDGTQGNGPSDHPRISLDGRFIVFESGATNLVDGDTNGVRDVFIRDRQDGTTERVSVNDLGVQGDGVSIRANVSADGRFVAFGSDSTNLVPGDTNNRTDVFIHDRETGLTERVSVDSNGVQANGSSFGIQMSADGQVVVFLSLASDLVVGDTNGQRDVFAHHRESGVTERVSLHSDGSQSLGESGRNRISADGRFAAFESSASDLVTGDTNGVMDAFVRDLELRITELISLASDGEQGNGESSRPSLNFDGRFVTFSSFASNLVAGISNGVEDAFIHDRQTGVTERITVNTQGDQANGSFSRAGYNAVSADGRFVAFISDATNLVSGDSNGVRDIFVRDLESNFVGVDTFTYVATDGTRNSNLATVTVTVGPADNVGAITSDVLANPNPAAVNTEISLTANVDDSATGGSLIDSVEFSIDDPEFLLGSVMADTGGTFVATIAPFAEAGVHEICVRGTDAAGNVGVAECILLAVYDPDGSFVTGGGWIVSPPGAYVEDPSLTGKANFGFVSKYKKGTNVPTGQTEFRFKLADLDFHSTSYQFLVVAAAKAIFKGDGTIGGGGDYGFMIAAIDEKLTPSSDVDLFRIRIWDKNDGDAVVYDNGLGSDENSDPTTELGGGNIVIHEK